MSNEKMTRRTFIIDNGGEYSDHALAFVETSAEESDMEALVAALGRASVRLTNPEITGVIDGKVMWNGKGPPSLSPRALVGEWLMDGWGSTWTEKDLREFGVSGPSDEAEAEVAALIMALLDRIDPRTP